MEEEYLDDWLEQQQVQQPRSLFKKQVIEFSNSTIQANIDRKMEKPILNQQFQTQPQGPEEEQEVAEPHLNATNNKEWSKQEALFNPLEDEENQQWTKRHYKQSKRPLVCPSCFTQITFNYTAEQQQDGVLSYMAREIFGAEVQESKIIRQSNLSERMIWSGVESASAEEQLRQRQEAFNIKILTECQCGHTVGYFDVNKEQYVLTNVI